VNEQTKSKTIQSKYDYKLVLFRRILSRKQLFSLLCYHASLY